MTDVEREILLPDPASDVWEAITDPGSLGDWFGAALDGELVPGEVARFRWPDGAERRALVETVAAPRRLAFRWLPDEDGSVSRVEIEIDETQDGTRVRVTETKMEAAVSPSQRIGFRSLASV